MSANLLSTVEKLLNELQEPDSDAEVLMSNVEKVFSLFIYF